MQPSKISILLIAVSLLLLGVGCDSQTKYEDVSSDPSLRHFVGVKYESRVPMHLSGVNGGPGYGKTVDYYMLSDASPGWTGPELITRETLAVGSVVQVESIHRATNIPFKKKAYMVQVRIAGYTPKINRPIRMLFEYLNSEELRKIEERDKRID